MSWCILENNRSNSTRIFNIILLIGIKEIQSLPCIFPFSQTYSKFQCRQEREFIKDKLKPKATPLMYLRGVECTLDMKNGMAPALDHWTISAEG